MAIKSNLKGFWLLVMQIYAVLLQEKSTRSPRSDNTKAIFKNGLKTCAYGNGPRKVKDLRSEGQQGHF